MRLRLLQVSVILLSIAFASCKKEAAETPPKIEEPVKITELDRPINLKATKGDFGTQIAITWTPMPLAKKYQLYKFSDSEQQYKLLKELTDTTFTDITSVPYVKNFYKVKTFNSANEYSPFSDVDYGYTSGQTYSRFITFGSEGYGNGQFQFAMHAEVDKDDNIYISETNNSGRIQKFSKNGGLLEVFIDGGGSARGLAFLKNGNMVITQTQSSNYVKILNANKQMLTGWGTYGTDENQFGNIEQICVDDDQNIYVVDGIDNSIKKFDQTGKLLVKFGTTNTGKLDAPFGVCYLKNYLYVSDPRLNSIFVYDKTGKFIKSWNIGTGAYGIKTDGEKLYIGYTGYIIKTDPNGEVKEKIGVGQLGLIADVALTKDGQIIAVDTYARKIFIYKKM